MFSAAAPLTNPEPPPGAPPTFSPQATCPGANTRPASAHSHCCPDGVPAEGLSMQPLL